MADTYKVTGQRQSTVEGAGGMLVPALEVHFETIPSGVTSSVRLPLSAVTPDAVDKAIRAQADLHERIQGL